MQIFGNYITISMLIKLIFLGIFISLTIYFIILERELTEAHNEEFKAGTFTDKKRLKEAGILQRWKELAVTIIPALITYDSYIKGHLRDNYDKRGLEEHQRIQEKLDQQKKLVQESKELSLQEKTKYYANMGRLQEKGDEVIRLNEKESLLNQIHKQIISAEEKEKNGETLSPEDKSLLASKVMNALDRQRCQDEKSRAIMEMDKTSKEIKEEMWEKNLKSGILAGDFDYFKNFIDSLSLDEKLAFSGLLLNYLVLSNVLSIVLIVYGNYLIQRFDLEKKYPKIAKFIQLRVKLQKIYIRISLVWILIGILLQIGMSFYVLEPVITGLFS